MRCTCLCERVMFGFQSGARSPRGSLVSFLKMITAHTSTVHIAAQSQACGWVLMSSLFFAPPCKTASSFKAAALCLATRACMICQLPAQHRLPPSFRARSHVPISPPSLRPRARSGKHWRCWASSSCRRQTRRSSSGTSTAVCEQSGEERVRLKDDLGGGKGTRAEKWREGRDGQAWGERWGLGKNVTDALLRDAAPASALSWNPLPQPPSCLPIRRKWAD